MNKDNFTYLDDSLSENKVNYLDLFEYVVQNKNFEMELTEFYIIESGFREIWNNNSGEVVGDGEFKNFVCQHIEKEIQKKTIQNHIPQNEVDGCVDLILEYMASIGQWHSDFSKS